MIPADAIRAPRAADDKYSRGVVGMRIGSEAYPGAAVLGVEAAWRTGVGMVRYVGPRRAARLVLERRPETVLGEGRVQAWVVGSGMVPAPGRRAAETAALRGILSGAVPVIVDAGALDLAPDATAPLLVTPHAREHDLLRDRLGLDAVPPDADDDARAAAALETARSLGAAVLLKGSVTIVAAPGGAVARVGPATPWLATAGTGDVLAGIVGALTAAAGGLDGVDAFVGIGDQAAQLHARAALIAAGDLGPRGGPVTALDIAAALPRAVAELLA